MTFGRRALVSVAGLLLLCIGVDADATATSEGLSLSDPRGTLTRESWLARRMEIRAAWLDVLGPMPGALPRAAAAVEVLTTETESDHTRHLVRYCTEPGDVAYAFVLVPKGARGAAPGAIVFHGTSNSHIYQPAGLADSESRHLGVKLVRRGYVVIAPRCFIFGTDERLTTQPRGVQDYAREAQRIMRRDPRRTGMGKMLWDGMRAVDVLTSWPGVDASRIVAMGHSLGAKEALYLAAFDERVAAAVANEGGVGLALSNWDAVWYLGAQVKGAGFARDHHELLALVAPRAIMISGGGSADGEKSARWVDAARPAFQALGAEENLELRVNQGGHDFPPEAFEYAAVWLEGRLAK